GVFGCHLSSLGLVFMVCFLMCRDSPRSTLFPYTTLFRSRLEASRCLQCWINTIFEGTEANGSECILCGGCVDVFAAVGFRTFKEDRKSTRLNSSHRTISYAVFCLKKELLVMIPFSQWYVV